MQIIEPCNYHSLWLGYLFQLDMQDISEKRCMKYDRKSLASSTTLQAIIEPQIGLKK